MWYLAAVFELIANFQVLTHLEPTAAVKTELKYSSVQYD